MYSGKHSWVRMIFVQTSCFTSQPSGDSVFLTKRAISSIDTETFYNQNRDFFCILGLISVFCDYGYHDCTGMRRGWRSILVSTNDYKVKGHI